MPYIGLLPFLPNYAKDENKEVRVCQCPTSGFSHFYSKKAMAKQNKSKVCQCPTSGFSHFYHEREVRNNNIIKCVNALHRASPISTLNQSQNLSQRLVSMPYIGLLPFLQYPLKNLIKSMVSGTVFRG